MTKKHQSEYELQAENFAKNCGLTMTANYTGHRARFNDHVTAVFQITLYRADHEAWSFEFSTSINDSYSWTEEGNLKRKKGLPPRLKMDSFFDELKTGKISFNNGHPACRAGGGIIRQTKTTPTLYDVLACLTKHDPGIFNDFCGDYGYNNDSIKAQKTYFAVQEEFDNCSRLFGDVIDQLAEIN